jgi:hypothetical protein
MQDRYNALPGQNFMTHSLKIFISVLTLGLTTNYIYGQTITIDSDSILVISSYNDFMTALKKDNTKENYEYRKNYIDTLKINSGNITITGEVFEEHFGRELDWLIKKKKLTFFDKRNNKLVTKLKRIKSVKSNNVVYDLYLDAESNNALYCLIKHTPSF